MFHVKDELIYDGKENFGGTYATMQVAPIHEPKNGHIDAAWNTQYCRDGIGSVMRDAIADGSLETDKLRLLFAWYAYNEKVALEWCGRGLKCLHACEKLAGWPLTRLIRVKHGPKSPLVVYARASRRWMKAPYMVTLYILLMRMCDDRRWEKVKNFDDLIDIADKTDRNSFKRDGVHIRGTYKYWKAMILGYPHLFEQYKLSYYWDSDRVPGVSSNGYGEGILKLCQKQTAYTEARIKLEEVQTDITKNGKLTLKRKKTKKK